MMSELQISTQAKDVAPRKNSVSYNKSTLKMSKTEFWHLVTKQLLTDKSITEAVFEGVGRVSRQALNTLIQLNMNVEPRLIPEYARKIAALHITEDSILKTNFTCLHLAAIADRDDDLPLHLKTIPADTVDTYGRTPLHLAAYLGHYQIAQKLLQHGASVQFCAHLFGTAYTQAILGKQIAMLPLLQRHETKNPPSVISKIATGLFTQKHPRNRNSRRLYQESLIRSGEPQMLSKYYDYETALRHLYHSWKIDWDLKSTDGCIRDQKIFYRKGKTTIDFTPMPGGFGCYFLGQMAKATNQFVTTFTRDPTFPLSSFPLLIETLNLGSNQRRLTPNTLYTTYRSHNPLILAVEFEKPAHSTSVLIWENYICLSNRGCASRRAVEVFHFHPRMLSSETLCQLLALIESKQDFTTLIFDKLRHELQMYKSKDTLALELLLSLAPQLIGNCSWESQETAVFVFLVLSELITNPDSDSDLSKVVQKARFIWSDWRLFQQLYALEKYLKIFSDPEYKCFVSNHPMCQEIYSTFQSFKKNLLIHPILQNKISELEKCYPILATFSQSHAIL
jgi:hypothetical protein